MVATNYVWNPVFDCITKETNDAGATVARYTQEPKHYGGLISQHRSGATSIYHYDAIGTTRALTDNSQAVTDTAVYSAFGEKVTSTGTTVNPFSFIGIAGYHQKWGVSQFDVRARKYESRNVRWLSRDPMGQDNSLYQYALNMPTVSIDPSGLKDFKVCCHLMTETQVWTEDFDCPTSSPNNHLRCCTNLARLRSFTYWAAVTVLSSRPGACQKANPKPTPKLTDCNRRDYLDCLTCCEKVLNLGGKLDETLVVIGGARKVKVISISKVDTTMVFAAEWSRIGTAVGKQCTLIGPKLGRTIVRRGVAVMVIVEGFYEWGLLFNCTAFCTGAYD